MSPSQSPSSMYSHAPTVIHHSAHRSALARRATRQLSKWTESPSSSRDHHSDTSSPRASAPTPARQQADYTYNGNYSSEYKKTSQSPAQILNRYQPSYSPYNDEDGNNNDAYAEEGDDSDPITSVQSQSGPTVRKYSELNFDDEDDEIGFVQMGRREKVGQEWGTPESALAGIGRQATRMMRAATTGKKGVMGNGVKDGGGAMGLGLGIGGILSGGTYGTGAKGKDISPSTSVTSKTSSGARQRMGDLLSTASRQQKGRDRAERDRDFLTSGSSKVSIASDRSRETATTRASSSESSVGEAIITPNHSSAFTPYHDHAFSSAIKYTYPTRSTAAAISANRTPTLAPSAQIYDQATSAGGPSSTLSPSPAAFSLSPTPSGFTASDRPLMSSGSPGFGLISLEVAQERERVRLGGPTPKSSSSKKDKLQQQQQQQQTTPRLPSVPTLSTTQSQKIRNKKSLISLFRSATSYASGNGGGNGGSGSAPPVPGFSMVGTGTKKMNIGEPMPLIYPAGQAEMATPSGPGSGRHERESAAALAAAEYREAQDARSRDISHTQSHTSTQRSLLPGPKLELRPVSMMLANGLPEDYLASNSSSDITADDGSFAGGDGRSSVFTTTASLSTTSSANLGDDIEGSDTASAEVLALRKELANLKKTHAYQQSELSSQLREMKDQLQATRDEMEELQVEKERRAPREDGCTECGCTCGMAVSEMLMGSAPSPRPATANGSVMGRARSGTTSRSVRSVKSTRSTTSGRTNYSGIQVPTAPLPERSGIGSKGVMDRGRAKTGGARGVFGTGSLYEWE